MERSSMICPRGWPVVLARWARSIQHGGGVEVPAIDRFSLDRASGAFGQSVGPRMIRFGETVPDPAPSAPLREWMDFGGASPGSPPIAPQRELPPIVGQHAANADALAAPQERASQPVR